MCEAVGLCVRVGCYVSVRVMCSGWDVGYVYVYGICVRLSVMCVGLGSRDCV